MSDLSCGVPDCLIFFAEVNFNGNERLQGIQLDFVSSRSEAVRSSVRVLAQGATQRRVVRVFALPRTRANIVRSMCCRP